MEQKEMAKTRLIIYVLMAYGLTYLMGILMWYGSTKGYDLTVFPTAQMMYPAAGVIIGLFLAHKGEKILPAGFFITVLATTGVLIVLALLSVFLPVNDLNIAGMTMSVYNLISQYILIIGSIVALVFLAVAGNEKRAGSRTDQTKLEKCCAHCTCVCGYLYSKNCSVCSGTGCV